MTWYGQCQMTKVRSRPRVPPHRGQQASGQQVAAQDKIHFCARNMGQRAKGCPSGRPGPAPGSVRDQGAGRTGERATRRHPGRAPPPGNAAAVVPRAGRGPGHRPQHGRRGLQPAGRRGMADRADRGGDLRRSRRAAAPGAAVAARPASRRPATTCGPGCPTCRRSRAAPGSRRPAVLAAAPDHLLGYPDPRGLPQLRTALADYLARAPGRDRRSRVHRHLRGFRAGLAGIAARCARRARPPSRWRRTATSSPRHRRRAGPGPRRCPSTAWAPSSARPPGRTRCC